MMEHPTTEAAATSPAALCMLSARQTMRDSARFSPLRRLDSPVRVRTGAARLADLCPDLTPGRPRRLPFNRGDCGREAAAMPDDDGEALAPLDALLRWVATPGERAALEAWRDPALTPRTLQSFANWRDAKAKNYGFEREWPKEDARVYQPPEAVKPVYERACAALECACARLTTLLAGDTTGEWSYVAKARRLSLGAVLETLAPSLFFDLRVTARLDLPGPYDNCTSLSGRTPDQWKALSDSLDTYAKGPRIDGPRLVRVNPKRQRERFEDLWRPESFVICRARTGGASAAAEPGSLEVAPSAVVAKPASKAEKRADGQYELQAKVWFISRLENEKDATARKALRKEELRTELKKKYPRISRRCFDKRIWPSASRKYPEISSPGARPLDSEK